MATRTFGGWEMVKKGEFLVAYDAKAQGQISFLTLLLWGGIAIMCPCAKVVIRFYQGGVMRTTEILITRAGNMASQELGRMSRPDPGHWLFGDDHHFPIQIEQLAGGDHVLIYGSFAQTNGEAVYTPLLSAMLLENMIGFTMGKYGICSGVVSFTVFRKACIGKTKPQQMVCLVTEMRQKVEYLRSLRILNGEVAEVDEYGEQALPTTIVQ